METVFLGSVWGFFSFSSSSSFSLPGTHFLSSSSALYARNETVGNLFFPTPLVGRFLADLAPSLRRPFFAMEARLRLASPASFFYGPLLCCRLPRRPFYSRKLRINGVPDDVLSLFSPIPKASLMRHPFEVYVPHQP